MSPRRLGYLAAIVLFAAPAAAADPAIADFAGEWVGKVTVETEGPTDFPTSVRDSGVTVTPDDKGGFSLEWSTAKRESGDPQDPTEKVQDTVVLFVKDEAANVWHAEGGDPAAGKPIWLARLDGDTLVVTGFNRGADGATELQTYRRTLEDGSLGLVYTRIVDGAVTRRASGALTRFAR